MTIVKSKIHFQIKDKNSIVHYKNGAVFLCSYGDRHQGTVQRARDSYLTTDLALCISYLVFRSFHRVIIKFVWMLIFSFILKRDWGMVII